MNDSARHCPRCGYVNVQGATFCFRCNRHLDDEPVVEGLDGIGDLISGALRFIRERGHHKFGPDQIERLREARSKLLPENLNGEPLTCLHCGTFNLPDALECVQCKSQLIVPDLDLEIIARPGARTNVGQVRQNNEDNVGLWALHGVVLVLVADGMGGAAAGEVASQLAVEAVQASFAGADRNGHKQIQVIDEDSLSLWMRDALLDANRAVVERAQKEHARKGMGTTSTLALIRGNRILIAHVGDSRVYLVDSERRRAAQLTTDHSYVQALVISGLITPEQAKHHPMGHVLYRALGQSLELEVDLYRATIHSGDRIVVCSDGLVRHVAPDEIANVVARAAHPAEATYDLVELTNTRGGEDNVTAVVVMIDSVSG